MSAFIKLAIFSFPFALLAFIYWPGVDRHDSPAQSVPAPLKTFPQKISSQQQSERPGNEQPQMERSVPAADQADAKIYRWVDENGRLTFSDKPNHQNAEAFTPEEIGYMAVSGIEQASLVQKERPVFRDRRIALKALQSQMDNSPPIRKEVNAYKFSTVSAGQKYKYVMLSGRISQGSACKRLRITATAKSDMGGYVSGQDEVSFAGFGSALFEIRKSSRWNGDGRRPQWEVDRLSAVCVER